MIKESGSLRGGVYIHIPYCIGKCTYCSFYSIGGVRSVDWNVFAESIIDELCNRIEEIEGWNEITIYIGGGTPSLMDGDTMFRMLRSIRDIIGDRCGEDVKFIETTMEINPDDVTDEKAKIWKASGINRISMGVQSMVDTELKAIGRRHNSAQVVDAYKFLRRYFDNISLDLIFGLPGQTMDSLDYTLSELIGMKPEHLSAYSLMYEERSVLARQLESGKIEELSEDITVDMFRMITSRLRGAGYERYEIANYSLPGKRSIHNSSYWEGIPYVGLGPSAHSYDGMRRRRWNIADIRSYSYNAQKGSVEHEEEFLTSDELREEMMMTRLRVKEGLDLFRFRDRFGLSEYDKIMDRCKSYINSGNIEIIEDHLRLTDSGVMISDEIISGLF